MGNVKYGARVLYNVKEMLVFNNANGDTKRRDAIINDVSVIMELRMVPIKISRKKGLCSHLCCDI